MRVPLTELEIEALRGQIRLAEENQRLRKIIARAAKLIHMNKANEARDLLDAAR
jgi:hypothetical protein